MAELHEESKKDRTGVELFAGAGGLAMAVHRAGFRPLLFNEFAKRACETLEANGAKRLPEGEKPTEAPEPGQKVPLVAGDVQDLEMGYLKGQVDVLAGGPPCQPFSLGGVAKGDEDKRNMFPQMFKAVRQMQPRAVICENVRGLLRPSFKDYFQYILRELELPFEERGEGVDWREHNDKLIERLAQEPDDLKLDDLKKRYKVVMTPVNAADYGVPQIRNRVIIVAFRRDLNVDIELFKELVKPTHSETALIRSMMDGEATGSGMRTLNRMSASGSRSAYRRSHPRMMGCCPGTRCEMRSRASATTSRCQRSPMTCWTAPSVTSRASRSTSGGRARAFTTATRPTNWTDRPRP